MFVGDVMVKEGDLITVDGICGESSWAKLLSLVSKYKITDIWRAMLFFYGRLILMTTLRRELVYFG